MPEIRVSPHQEQTMVNSIEPGGRDMIHEIMEELRHIRRRLDGHIDDEKDTLGELQRDVSKIREEMAGHKTKLGIIAAGISIAIASFVSWLGFRIE